MKKGFTLIETLVVVGILMILMGGGVAGFTSMNDRARLEESANMVLAGLLNAQKSANAGAYECNIPGQSFRGVIVNGNTGSQLTTSNLCGDPNPGTYTIENSIIGVPEQELDTTNHVMVSAPSFIFRTRSGGVQSYSSLPTVNYSPLPGGIALISIYYSNRPAFQRYYICITSSGGMRAQNNNSCP